MSEWIKCSEKLPEFDVDVLCVGAGYRGTERHRHWYVWCEVLHYADYPEAPWQDDDEAYYQKDAVWYWMPLPEFPLMPEPEKTKEQQSKDSP